MAETRTISARKGDGSQSGKPQRTRITKRKALENHARSYFDAIARRDVDAMMEHWKEDGVVDLVPIGILRGADEISAFFSEMFTAFPDAEMTVARVAAMIDRAEYKRRQAAPGVKITPKAFGKDRRLPITNRYIAQRGPD